MGHNVAKTELIFIEELHNNPDVERIHIASQPTRLRILHLLTDKSRMYATQIGETLSIDRKIITFHLNALEEAELVTSKYGLSEDKRPVAVKYYELTSKGKEILERILQMIK
ncbi:MAG: helix-turn-helix domain-containing protein [Nitrososphaeraceae archaeon]|nr:helix-turn-helix domain-containing protein [Nitrososphaeraceae archaeon]